VTRARFSWYAALTAEVRYCQQDNRRMLTTVNKALSIYGQTSMNETSLVQHCHQWITWCWGLTQVILVITLYSTASNAALRSITGISVELWNNVPSMQTDELETSRTHWHVSWVVWQQCVPEHRDVWEVCSKSATDSAN